MLLLFQYWYNNYYTSLVPRDNEHYLALLDDESSDVLRQEGYGYNVYLDEDSLLFDEDYDDEFQLEYTFDDDGNMYMDGLPYYGFGKLAKVGRKLAGGARKAGRGLKKLGGKMKRNPRRAVAGAVGVTAAGLAIAGGVKAAQDGVSFGEGLKEVFTEGTESAVQNDQCNPMVVTCLEEEGHKASGYPDAWPTGMFVNPEEATSERHNLDWYIGPADGSEGMGIIGVHGDGSLNKEKKYTGDCIKRKEECYEMADEKGFAAPFWIKCKIMKDGSGLNGILDGIMCNILEALAGILGGGKDSTGEGLITTMLIPFIELYEKYRLIIWGLIAWKLKPFIEEQMNQQ